MSKRDFASVLAAGSLYGSVPTQKKSTGEISVALKRIIWDMYIGPGIMHTMCPLCGVQDLSRDYNSGFEAAHIVAKRYFQGDITKYYAYPSCRSCNNECRDACILDYLYNNGRLAQLRTLIRIIFKAYSIEHEHTLAHESRLAPIIIKHLYGPQRWVGGGGIVKEKEIYEIARSEHYEILVTEANELATKMAFNSKLMCILTGTEIKPTIL